MFTTSQIQHVDMPQAKLSLPISDLMNVTKGACMGAADVVPGVSGGTVALIVGIYDRLVTAISQIDVRLVKLLRKGEFRAAAEHMDLRFLMSLAVGLGFGFVLMTAAMHAILTRDVKTYSLTLAAFSGMILMSTVFVARNVSRWNVATILPALGGLILAGSMAFAQTPTAAGDEPTMVYVFVSGAIAICAMILPGISGAMILMLLGVYLHLSEIPHLLKDGERVGHCLTTIAVFGTGCLISLILFSKFLRWLLGKYQDATMATMCGFMVGALPKLWPFRIDTSPEIEKFKYKKFEYFLPDSAGELLPVLAVVATAAAFVFTVDYVSRKRAATVTSEHA